MLTPTRHRIHGNARRSAAFAPKAMTSPTPTDRVRLLRRGVLLEQVTLGWNVAGIAVLAVAALRARSVALAGFGLDSLIEIGASTVVLWELAGAGHDRQRKALRLIAFAFLALACYIAVQSVVVLATLTSHAAPSTSPTSPKSPPDTGSRPGTQTTTAPPPNARPPLADPGPTDVPAPPPPTW